IVDVNSWHSYSSFERRMSREVWADYTVQTPLWSATLSSRQRVLLHAQPILAMRQSWTARADQSASYDPLCLSMKLFEVVIDQSGLGNEVGRQAATDALCPLLAALD